MAQRLRVTFARGEELKYLSHLETMRMWERMLRRAGWRLAYSQGFSPHPRLSFAAALPVGVAGDAELLEVYLEEPLPLERALQELSQQAPPGASVREIQEMPADTPHLQRAMVAAEYLAVCPEGTSPAALRGEVDRLLAATTLPRQRAKEGKTVAYDLRPMVRALSVTEGPGGRSLVCMELRTDAQGAGRPDELLRELGLDPADCRITRTRLLLAGAGT